jgi:hypothetical protein
MLPSENPATVIITIGATTSMKAAARSFASRRNSFWKTSSAARSIAPAQLASASRSP